jgi:DNA-binding NarL/FixJ family response regulator
VRGKSNKEIARSLACAENTVELHVTQLLRRASASSRAELIARYWSASSVHPRSPRLGRAGR